MHLNADERVLFKRDTVLTNMQRITFPATPYCCDAAYLEKVTPVWNWINHSNVKLNWLALKKHFQITSLDADCWLQWQWPFIYLPHHTHFQPLAIFWNERDRKIVIQLQDDLLIADSQSRGKALHRQRKRKRGRAMGVGGLISAHQQSDGSPSQEWVPEQTLPQGIFLSPSLSLSLSLHLVSLSLCKTPNSPHK